MAREVLGRGAVGRGLFGVALAGATLAGALPPAWGQSTPPVSRPRYEPLAPPFHTPPVVSDRPGIGAPGGWSPGSGPSPELPVCPPLLPPWWLVGPPVIVAPYPYPYPVVSGVPQPPPPVSVPTPSVATPSVPTPNVGPSAIPGPLMGGLPAAVNSSPLDPAALAAAMERPAVSAAGRASRRDRERAEERVKVGDRLFRAKDYRRAAERYQQAVDADPGDARPYVRLAQLAVARGRYAEAADHLREAQAAQPGWQRRAGDVQNLFGDPADFDAVLNRLESHLQTHPDDRDAWLVLGAELYLTGRRDRAADVLLRLTDRDDDDGTLGGFLSAAP